MRGIYLVSTVSEWLTAISIVTFVLTFYRDFSNISLRAPSIKIRSVDEAMKVKYHLIFVVVFNCSVESETVISDLPSHAKVVGLKYIYDSLPLIHM